MIVIWYTYKEEFSEEGYVTGLHGELFVVISDEECSLVSGVRVLVDVHS